MGLFRKKQKDNPIALEMKSLAEKAVEHGKGLIMISIIKGKA